MERRCWLELDRPERAFLELAIVHAREDALSFVLVERLFEQTSHDVARANSFGLRRKCRQYAVREYWNRDFLQIF